MFSALFRGLIFIIFMFWYSLGIWNAIENYFRKSFKFYLEKEYQKNVFKKPEILRSFGTGVVSAHDFNIQNVCTLSDYVNYVFFYWYGIHSQSL